MLAEWEAIAKNVQLKKIIGAYENLNSK